MVYQDVMVYQDMMVHQDMTVYQDVMVFLEHLGRRVEMVVMAYQVLLVPWS